VALQQEISISPEPRYDHRLHGLLFLRRGMSTHEVGNLLGHSPRTTQYWFHRFQEHGLMGLLDAEGGGWPSSLNPRQQKRLEADLRKPPSALGVSASAIFKSMDLDMLSGFLLG
jgi:transposase